jgi:hypothetical protein
MLNRMIAILAIGTAVGYAQAPPQFANLLTNSTDYTCAGTVPCATWPMPPMPAAGSSYTDPTWGTTTYRLAVSPANAAKQVIPVYSRVQAFNADNTLMFAVDLSGDALDLYDATVTPPKPINKITTDLGTAVYPDSVDNDALWAFTDPHRIYFQASSGSPYGLSLMYVDVSTCTVANCVLHANVVHTFSCATDALSNPDLGAGIAGNKIETGSGGQGGMFDNTDRYFSFTCDKVDGAGRHEIDFIRYDRTLDTVTTQTKWYNLCPGQTPAGCAVYAKSNLRKDMIRMNQHPDSRFITVIWQCGARDALWSRGCGTEVFDPSYNYLGVASPYDGHQDVGFDVHGTPVLVTVGTFRNDVKDSRALGITDLTAVSQTAQTYKRILLPCSYSRAGTVCDSGTSLQAKLGASHFSMTGTWGSVPGYGLLSTMMLAGPYIGLLPDYPTGTTLGNMATSGAGVVSTVGSGTGMETMTLAKSHASTDAVRCLSCGDTGFAAMENVAVLIDATVPDGSNAQFWRIGRTMAIRDATYDAEPHTSVNRDWTAILWGSTWNVDPKDYTSVQTFWSPLK